MVNNNLALISKIKELAKIHSIPESVVEDAFNSQFEFFRDIVNKLDLNDASEEEVQATKTNFNYKYLGKFYTHPRRIDKIKTLKYNKDNNNEEN